MTATHLARRLAKSPEYCSRHLRRLASLGIVECLNPQARCGRVYALTRLGHRCRHRLGLPPVAGSTNEAEGAGVDWGLLGWVCFRHRSAVIKAMTAPMQAVTIRRKAMQQNCQLRMNANNVREVLHCLASRSIVRRVELPDTIYPHFELTELGKQLQQELWRADGTGGLAGSGGSE